jgi:NitT/TauT family transport system substrate-binding protein/putative hydroxymethylpyrimidine transport system substrate-binding protein
MRRVAAPLAAVLALGLTACGDDGAEPGASTEATLPSHAATLVLDFTPNAVHSGIYSALYSGYFDDEDIDLTVREPGSSTDAPKLLAAGRTEFAILDIQDLAIARERGIDLVALAPVVDQPLAAVIASANVSEPSELEGGRVGVTGLPSDDAVLDTVLAGGGVDPGDVERTTIGFQAVAALAAGRVDAATAFRNAEGVELERQGVPVNVFGVEDFGAPRFPELVLVTSRDLLDDDPELARGMADALALGSEAANEDRTAAIDALVAANPELDPEAQTAQIAAIGPHLGGGFDRQVLVDWARWAATHGIVEQPPDVEAAFDLRRP